MFSLITFELIPSHLRKLEKWPSACGPVIGQTWSCKTASDSLLFPGVGGLPRCDADAPTRGQASWLSFLLR